MRFTESSVEPFNKFKKNGTDFSNLLSPILSSLCVLGVRIDYNSSSQGAVKTTLIKMQLIVVLILFHYWALTDVLWYFKNPIKEGVLSDSITIWSTVCTVDLLLLKRKDIARVLEVVEDETGKLCDRETKTIRNVVRLTCAVIWLFVLIFMIQYMVLNDDMDYRNHFANTPLSALQGVLSENQQRLLIKIDRTVESFFIQGSLTMIIALYILLCYIARMWFKGFTIGHSHKGIAKTHGYNHPKSDRNCGAELEYVRRFRTDLEQLWRHVELIDNVFSQCVAVWLLMILINLCVRILGIFNPNSLTSLEMIFVASLSFVRAAAILLGVTFAADSVQKEATMSVRILDHSRKQDILSAWDMAVYNELQLTFIRFPYFQAQLTVWKFTNLNRSFLMTCVGMMMTYVIICIQLNPTAMNAING